MGPEKYLTCFRVRSSTAKVAKNGIANFDGEWQSQRQMRLRLDDTELFTFPVNVFDPQACNLAGA
jgi:hypothetical protein